MDKMARQGLMGAAVLGLCATGLMNAALANPPSSRGANLVRALDLRPPTVAIEAGRPAGGEAGKALGAFPSALHRSPMGEDEKTQLPTLGSGSERVPSRAEEFARRVHREGLPVARLWENKSALVSLGLSPKGKPGLWITQKIH